MMTSSQVVETSVSVITDGPSQDYTHRDYHALPTCDISWVQTIYSKCYLIQSQLITELLNFHLYSSIFFLRHIFHDATL